MNEAIKRFCDELDRLLAEHNRSNGYNWTTRTDCREARKFFRVARVDSMGGNSIWFLVDKETGFIYKPSTYLGGPANKIVRGSIFKPASDVWELTLSPYGICDAR